MYNNNNSLKTIILNLIIIKGLTILYFKLYIYIYNIYIYNVEYHTNSYLSYLNPKIGFDSISDKKNKLGVINTKIGK